MTEDGGASERVSLRSSKSLRSTKSASSTRSRGSFGAGTYEVGMEHLPQGWKVQRSKKYGRFFYVDTGSGKAVWKKPTEVAPGFLRKAGPRGLLTAYQTNYPLKNLDTRGPEVVRAVGRAVKGLRGCWRGPADPSQEKTADNYVSVSKATFTAKNFDFDPKHHKLRPAPPDARPEHHEFDGNTTNNDFFKGEQPKRAAKKTYTDRPPISIPKPTPLSTETTNNAIYTAYCGPSLRPRLLRPAVKTVRTSPFTATTHYQAAFNEEAYEIPRFCRLKRQHWTPPERKCLYKETRNFETTQEAMARQICENPDVDFVQSRHCLNHAWRGPESGWDMGTPEP